MTPRQHTPTPAHTRNAGADRTGFSIIELLVAIIIIAILAAILIPIVANRTEQARITRALSDLERIGDALERVAIDTGFHTRLFMLNDTVGPASGAFQRTSPIDPTFQDTVRQYAFAGGYHQNLDRLFLRPGDGDLVTTTEGATLRQRLVQDETGFNWHGPYINWQRDSNFYIGDVTPLPDGIPDDPWGNNYLLFTRDGLILEPNGVLATGSTALPPNTAGAQTTPVAQIFDRLTLVSLGPNGLPGDGSPGALVGTGDDIVRSIGQ